MQWREAAVGRALAHVNRAPSSSDGTITVSHFDILCARFGDHLDHPFNDAPTPSGPRYCANAAAIDVAKADDYTSRNRRMAIAEPTEPITTPTINTTALVPISALVLS